MARENLPGIVEVKQDGNTITNSVNSDPVSLILGTASKGRSETLYGVQRVADAASEFGKAEGTLTRGMYEVSVGGAENVNLFRTGATSATLTGVGTGITVETVSKDDSAGTDYLIFWDDTGLRLRLWRASDDELVYDNIPSSPSDRVDLRELDVTGTATTGAGDIGTLSVPVTLAAADAVGGAVYTAGTDGLTVSRMKLYEHLYNAYELLEDQEIDVVVPMDVYLDDLNVRDMNEATVSGLSLAALTGYPVAAASDDALGMLYTEEFEGTNYFWWWFPEQPNASSPSFTVAQVFTSSGVGSATASATTDGTALTAGDFHEVNFGYQLADFCYRQATDNMDMTGVIGVKPPTSYSLKGAAQWVGTAPTLETDANGNRVVASGGNGTGLLGNKFLAGRLASGGVTGTPGFTIDGVEGLAYGGFIATDDHWLDGTQLEDDNDHLVDIGKYLSVVATWPVLANSSRTSAYVASGAATYAGFYSALAVNSAPTNKLLNSVRLPFRLNLAKIDTLAGYRFVTFHAKKRGIVVSDGPTAARPDSDYQRLSTMRQVKASMDAIRDVGEPFLGEAMTGAQTAALETALERVLQNLVKNGVIRRFEFQLIITPQQRVLGQATVELKLVPAFELRRITVSVALAAV